MRPTVSVQADDFDPTGWTDALSRGRGDVGAVASFVGFCRDENGRLSALELEHYPGMAEEEIGRVAEAAASRWPLLGLVVVHRFGVMRPGDRIVLVAAASAGRDPAFEAARFVMDYLKTSAPFWKREILRDGSAGPWVEPKPADDAAAAAWNEAGRT